MVKLKRLRGPKTTLPDYIQISKTKAISTLRDLQPGIYRMTGQYEMDSRFTKYISPLGAMIEETLRIIDANKKDFALITDGVCLIGVVTDGDIRRALLNGSGFWMQDSIGV